MAASNAPAPSAVIPVDPSRPFVPRILIADLLRTRYCVPSSVFLVESIETHIAVSKRYRTIRLLLGDGELCIQALLRPELHRFVDNGQVYVGSYVRSDRFELKSFLARVDPAGEGDDSKEPEETVFLLFRDLTVVGWNTAYMRMAGTTMHDCTNDADTPGHHLSSQEAIVHEKRSSGASKALVVAEPLGQDETAVPEEETAESRDGAHALHQHTTNTHSTHPAGESLSSMPGDLSKPLKLTPLKSIPNLPYKQNWVVNILAIVASLSEVEAATLPPFKQRTARLADPSTNKHVLLTVFLDPDGFTPTVGSVVLLLGVKNHRFDGGSLKKYGNERPKEGLGWWFENPKDVDWCDVDGLKKWWTNQSA